MYVIVNIQNTYVWIAPENRSKYTWSAAGQMIAIFERSAYTRAIITVPDRTFANRRSDKEIGTATKPITLIGPQNCQRTHKPTITHLTY